MAFEYSFKLNGEALYATLGVTVTDKLEEPLDEGTIHIPITTQNFEYRMLGLLEIGMRDVENDISKNFTYLIISDKVKTISKDNFYSHDLSAIEYTHKLDKFLINTLTFTRPFPVKRRAPFVYLPNEDVSITVDTLFPKIEINESYFIGKEITFKSVGEVKTEDYTTTNTSVFIKIDGGSPQNLTSSNITHTFSTKGAKEIIIGVLKSSVFIGYYKYFINVIDEKRYSLYDVLMRVRASAPIERKSYFENSRLFDIDESLIERFKQIEMPQMFIQKQTVRQVLNTIFKYINAISRLNYRLDGRDTLSIDEFNLITGVFDKSGDFDYQSEQNAQQYGTKALAWFENSLQSNFRDNPSIKSPAQDRFKTVRSSAVQLKDDSFNLKLEKPLYELSKIEVVIPELTVSITTVLGNLYDFTLNDYKLDLTTRFLEKSFWDLKQITVNFPSYQEFFPYDYKIGLRKNKIANAFWERNKKEINFSFLVGVAFKNNLIIEVITEALNEELTVAPFDFLGLYDDFVINGITISIKSFTNNLFRNLKYNIEYITLDDPTYQADRADVSEINYDTQMRVNQQERLTDFGRASRNVYGQLQRSSVPSHSFSRVYTDLKQDKTDNNLLDVGNIDPNGYIITNRYITFYNEHIEVMYEATKDHNRLNEFNGIDQQYRVFENPQFGEAYKRTDFYNDYVMILRPDDFQLPLSIDSEPTVFNLNYGLPVAFRRLTSNSVEPEKVTFAFVRTDGFLERYPDEMAQYHAIMTPVNSYGGKGSLVFEFGFESNLIAGDAIKKEGANFYNDPISYTDTQGFFDEFWFGLGNKYATTGLFPELVTGETYFNQEYKYPLIKSAQLNLQQNFLGQTGPISPEDIDYNPIISYKDVSSNYNVTYQVNILPLDYKEYVIGQAFYTDNRLVKNPDLDGGTNVSSKLYLYKYKDETQYNLFDDLLVEDGVYDKVEIIPTTNINYTDGQVDFLTNALMTLGTHTSWAIADDEGNLYIACNKPYNGLRVILRHFRPNIFKVGNKLTFFKDDVEVDVFVSDTTSGIVQFQYSFGIEDSVLISENVDGIKQEDFSSSITDNVILSSSTAGIVQENFSGVITENLPIITVVNGQKQLSGEAGIEETIILTESATGNIVTYLVTFVDWNGTVLKTQTVNLGGNATPPPDPTRTGYDFTGWSGIYTNVTSNQTVTATYQEITYTVLFKDWDGTILKSEEVSYGGNATPPSTPSRTGYTFDYWWGNYTNVTSNEIVIAEYYINSYLVTWKAFDGTTLKQETLEYLSISYAPTGTPDDAQWDYSWPASSVVVSGTQVVNETRVVKSYTITWKYHTGITASSETLAYGSISTAPAGTTNTVEWKYTWPQSSVTVIGTQTIIEIQSLQTYTVTFVDWNSTVLKTQVVNYNESATPPPDPTRSGYIFSGWSGVYTNVTSNRTITATYTLIPPTKEWVSSSQSEYESANQKGSTTVYLSQGEFNSGVIGCYSGDLSAFLSGASDYATGFVMRVRNAYLDPDTFEGEVCGTWQYYKVVDL